MMLYLLCFSFSLVMGLNVKIGENVQLGFAPSFNQTTCRQYSIECFNPEYHLKQLRHCNLTRGIFQRNFEPGDVFMNPNKTLIQNKISRFSGNETRSIDIRNVTFRDNINYVCENDKTASSIQLNIISPTIKCVYVNDEIMCMVEYKSKNEIKLVEQNISMVIFQCNQTLCGLTCLPRYSSLRLRLKDSIYMTEINKLRKDKCSFLKIFMFNPARFNKDGMMKFSFPETDGFINLRISPFNSFRKMD